MKVSIITATFNSEKTIRDTLNSVANQAYKNIEHIIVDGCSSDATLAIVKSYTHVSKIISEKDSGIYDAMNKGITVCTGDIIGILNSDDFYANKEVLSQIVALFASDPELECVYSDLDYVDKHAINKVTRKWRSGQIGSNSFINGWMPPHPTVFVRKSVYQIYGSFNTMFRFSADYEFMLRIIHKHKCKFAYLPIVSVKMRTGGLSNSSFKNRLLANREDRLA